MSTKRSQDQMIDKEIFLPGFNSTFADHEGEEFAKIIHDLVFQRYGDQRRLYRSKRLKVLREVFYPDLANESYSNVDKIKCSLISFQDIIRSKEEESIGKVGGESKEQNVLNRSQTFCVVKTVDELLDDQDDFLNNSLEVSQRQMNLTYTQSVGSEKISDLLSDRFTNNSTYTQSVGSENISDLLSDRFPNNSSMKSPSKSINDDNNNTIMEESNKIDDDPNENLPSRIEAQEMAIQELEKVLVFGRRRRGFAGSIPHIQAEKGLLVANLRKQVLTASLNNEFDCSSTRNNSLKGKITINNIRCDTSMIGDDHGIPPCYYLCIVQHKTTILCTDIVSPDRYGIVEFQSTFLFDNITNNFTIKLLLFKLQLKPDSETIGWRMSLRRRKIELPKLVLVGNRDISISNINKTDFPFENEILYANITACVHRRNKTEGFLTIERIVRKTKKETKLVSQKRWCILEGTDLKVFRGCQDVDYSEPIEVISLVNCKSCKPYYLTPTTLMLDFVHPYFGRTLYLPFDDKYAFRDWLNQINIAIATAKAFGL